MRNYRIFAYSNRKGNSRFGDFTPEQTYTRKRDAIRGLSRITRSFQDFMKVYDHIEILGPDNLLVVGTECGNTKLSVVKMDGKEKKYKFNY